MSGNPFGDANGTFAVLVDDEGRHALWPARARSLVEQMAE
jgi:uncharacterized protein YbdZ (MbtH family)